MPHRYDGCDDCKAYARAASKRQRANPVERARRNEQLRQRRLAKPRDPLEYITSRYGMTKDEYFALIVVQGGACAICGAKPPRLHIDHDHATGKIRGLLCGPCNKALGLLHDNPQSALAAAAYLLKGTS